MSNTTTNTARRPYLANAVGKNAKDVPYAYTLEGYIGSAAPFFAPAKDDKSAFLSVSMGLRGSAARLMALANGTYDKNATYGKKDENGMEKDDFASIRIYGKLAEELNDKLTKGIRVVVSGALDTRTYKNKAGEDAEELVVKADNIVFCGSKKHEIDPVISNRVGVASRSYTDKDGVVRTESLVTGLIGTVLDKDGKNPEVAVSNSGKKYLNFAIRCGVPAEKVYDLTHGIDTKNKEYAENRKIMYVTVFGEDAERLAKVIKKNAIIVVSGRVESEDFNGNITYKVFPNSRNLVVAKHGDTDPADAAGAAAPADSGYMVPEDDGDDGELPF